MKQCYLVLTNANKLPPNNSDFIGVDKGAFFCAKNNYQMIACVGDFDSVTNDEYNQVLEFCDNVIRHDPIKNYSDSELAINYAIELGYDKIVMIGGIQDRFDHSYVNLMLLKQYHKYLHIIDDLNHLFILDSGKHTILKDGYKYVSFFSLEDVVITLEKTKYLLNKFVLKKDNRLGLSNEIISNECTVSVNGLLLCVLSNDK